MIEENVSYSFISTEHRNIKVTLKFYHHLPLSVHIRFNASLLPGIGVSSDDGRYYVGEAEFGDWWNVFDHVIAEERDGHVRYKGARVSCDHSDRFRRVDEVASEVLADIRREREDGM